MSTGLQVTRVQPDPIHLFSTDTPKKSYPKNKLQQQSYNFVTWVGITFTSKLLCAFKEIEISLPKFKSLVNGVLAILRHYLQAPFHSHCA